MKKPATVKKKPHFNRNGRKANKKSWIVKPTKGNLSGKVRGMDHGDDDSGKDTGRS